MTEPKKRKNKKTDSEKKAGRPTNPIKVSTERIQEIMKIKNYTTTKLAKAMGRSRSWVSTSINRGEMEKDLLDELCDVLKVHRLNFTYITTDDGEDKPIRLKNISEYSDEEQENILSQRIVDSNGNIYVPYEKYKHHDKYTLEELHQKKQKSIEGFLEFLLNTVFDAKDPITNEYITINDYIKDGNIVDPWGEDQKGVDFAELRRECINLIEEKFIDRRRKVHEAENQPETYIWLGGNKNDKKG